MPRLLIEVPGGWESDHFNRGNGSPLEILLEGLSSTCELGYLTGVSRRQPRLIGCGSSESTGALQDWPVTARY